MTSDEQFDQAGGIAMVAVVVAVAAGICLAAGWLFGQDSMILLALVISCAGLLLTGVQAWRAKRRPPAEQPTEDMAADAEPTPEPVVDIPEIVALTPDSPVYVLAGRRRFHRSGCRVLADRPADELTLADAQDEEFTACTVCVPTETDHLSVTA
jgi:hypothetical protein